MKFLLLLIIYRLSLDWLYVNWICNFYDFFGFAGQWEPLTFIKSVLFLILGTKILNLKENASSIILYFIYLFYFVPFTSMVAYNAFENVIYELSYMVYWLILVWGYSFLKKYDLKRNDSLESKNNNIYLFVFYLIIIIICLNILFIGFVYTGFNFSFNLYDIYIMREMSNVIELPVLSSYLLTSAQLCIPIAIFYFATLKKYFFVVVLFVFSFLIFVTLAFKSTFFIGLLSMIIILLKIKYDRIKVLLSFCILCLSAIFEYIIFKTEFIVELIIRRALFWPNLLSFQYYDYFTYHSPDYFISSVFKWSGLDSEFSQTRIVKVIGETYYGYEMPANNGLLADAFANLGYLGILLMPIFLLAVLALLDKRTAILPIQMIVVPSFIIAVDLVNTFLSVTLLSHGLFLSIVLFYLLQKSDDHSRG